MSEIDALEAAKQVLESEEIQDETIVEAEEESIGGKESKDMQGKKVAVMDPKAKDVDAKKNKKTTDMKKSDASAEEEEEYKMKEMSMKMKEHMDALFGGEDLSEDFRNKASVIFESAINERVEAATSELQEQYDSRLAEELETVTNELTAKLDDYLNYVVKEWAEENEIAIEHGLKNEISESFITGLRELFENHNISIPEESFDALETANGRVEELEGKLQEQLEKNIELVKISENLEREQAFVSACDGLTDTEVEKFKSLSEGIEFDDNAQYVDKLNILKESYFGENTIVSEEKIEESSDGSAPLVESGSVMDNLVQSMSRLSNRPSQSV
jgi:hypothetical protein|tara:strand:- start:430 stop:1422 length:993 start_codon:yes stop_codon:yes gene_type:complete